MSADDLPGTGTPAPAIHYASHASLLHPTPAAAGPEQLDGIVVSAARDAGNLVPALQLGAELSTPVLVLCSRDARAARAVAVARSVPAATCVVIDVAAEPGAGLPALATAGFSEARSGAHGDLSLKRNLGLVLGRLAGWTRLLFLDDDISGFDPAEVRRAAGALDPDVAVGMPARDFPDNSVVCHARRLGAHPQDVFVSGSALAVHVPEVESFFPEIYNEDWLFLAPYLSVRRVAVDGGVDQQEYAPFELAHRARVQEFGDVLAEGLVGYLHMAELDPPPPVAYWVSFLAARGKFIDGAARGCRIAARTTPTTADRAMRSLLVAQRALARISAQDLVRYVDAWLADRETWRRHVRELPRLDGLDAALDHLRLDPAVLDDRIEPPAPRGRPGPAAHPSAPFRRACGE